MKKIILTLLALGHFSATASHLKSSDFIQQYAYNNSSPEPHKSTVKLRLNQPTVTNEAQQKRSNIYSLKPQLLPCESQIIAHCFK